MFNGRLVEKLDNVFLFERRHLEYASLLFDSQAIIRPYEKSMIEFEIIRDEFKGLKKFELKTFTK